jgi:branched-chain amino acid aminotransferase
VEEKPMTIGEWQRSCEDGSMREAFACGTAAVVSPIGRVRSADADWTVGDGDPGPVAARLRTALLDVQHGREPDRRDWVFPVD